MDRTTQGKNFMMSPDCFGPVGISPDDPYFAGQLRQAKVNALQELLSASGNGRMQR